MSENPIAYTEARDGFSDLDDLACDITAEDEWVFDPGEHEVANELFHPIHGIDSHRIILDDYLVLARRGIRCGPDLKFVMLRC
jgi:hypothetical protein